MSDNATRFTGATRYVLDKRGHIRYTHIGEGAYDETEAVIQTLMAEPDPPTS